MFFQERSFSSQENHQPVPPCVWINSPLDQHSDVIPLEVTLTLPRSHVHLARATNRTCQSGFGMPGGEAGGHVRSAPSSSCSLPGWGSGEGRRPSPAARWSSRTETWPLRKRADTTMRPQATSQAQYWSRTVGPRQRGEAAGRSLTCVGNLQVDLHVKVVDFK